MKIGLKLAWIIACWSNLSENLHENFVVEVLAMLYGLWVKVNIFEYDVILKYYYSMFWIDRSLNYTK